jgi:hypothetical protein
VSQEATGSCKGSEESSIRSAISQDAIQFDLRCYLIN